MARALAALFGAFHGTHQSETFEAYEANGNSMARYFASQQSHGQATWRSTVATCPSCHVVFCANDIVNATLSAGSLAGAQDNKEA